VAKELGLDASTVAHAVTELVDAGELIALDHNRAGAYMSRGGWARWQQQAIELLEAYHRQFPLRRGMPREEFKSRMPKNLASVFEAATERAASGDILHADAKLIRRPTHQVQFDPALQTRVDELLASFARAPFSPPSYAEAESVIGSEALNFLIEQGRLEKISSQVLLTPDAEKTMTDWVIHAIHERGAVTGAELRDQFNTSRKYAIAFLEYLDQKRITKRVGDARVLR
jgi:selenocysteine-specific elongation factor